MEMDSVYCDKTNKTPEAKYYLQWGLEPKASAIPAMHASLSANWPFACKSETFRSSCIHPPLILG